jgi:hypothetical protein
MDRIADRTSLVLDIIKGYATPVLLGQSYLIQDEKEHIYTVIDVPDYPPKFSAGIVVLVRLVEDYILIQEDTTDHPLWQELVNAGIPREKIILTYIGETLPDRIGNSLHTQ